MNFWLSPDDPTYFCIFLTLNAKNHALTQWPLICWACALTECPSLLEGGPYTRIHFILDCPPPRGGNAKVDYLNDSHTQVLMSAVESRHRRRDHRQPPFLAASQSAASRLTSSLVVGLRRDIGQFQVIVFSRFCYVLLCNHEYIHCMNYRQGKDYITRRNETERKL